MQTSDPSIIRGEMISLSSYNEIVLETVLSRSKNTVDTRYFEIYGYEGIVVHRNSPQKRAERVEKNPGTITLRENNLLGLRV